MLTSRIGYEFFRQNKRMRFCFILLVAMPTLAVSAEVPAPGRVKISVRVDERSGKLVRSVQVVHSVEVAPKVVAPVSAAAVPVGFAEPQTTEIAAEIETGLIAMIDRIAEENGVEAPLVHSVIRAESNYNTTALSPKGAEGLMQLIPSTARRFGVRNTFDARDNVVGGVKYLKFLLDYYKGDYPKAIAAYNAGENAVDRYNGIPPYAETRNYVYQVAKNLKAARAVQAKRMAQADANTQVAETPKQIVTSLGEDGKLYYRTP